MEEQKKEEWRKISERGGMEVGEWKGGEEKWREL